MSGRTRDAAVDEPIAVDVEDATRRERNVGRWDRIASAIAGGALVASGLRRRSPGGAATAFVGAALVARGAGGHSRLYERLGIDTAAGRSRPGASRDAVAIERSITVDGDPNELAAFVRDPDRLTRLVGGFAEVSAETGDRHRWRVEGPFGRGLEWRTRIVEDRPGDLLHWESLSGAAIPHEGTVRFRPAPADRGTVVALRLRYDPPGGSIGAAAMERLGFAPEALAGTALRRLKSLAETGEVATTEKNPSARGRGDLV